MQTIAHTPTLTEAERAALVAVMLPILDAIRPDSLRDGPLTPRIFPLTDGLELAFHGDEYRNDALILRPVGGAAIFLVTRQYSTPGSALGANHTAAVGKVPAIVAAIRAVRVR